MQPGRRLTHPKKMSSSDNLDDPERSTKFSIPLIDKVFFKKKKIR